MEIGFILYQHLLIFSKVGENERMTKENKNDKKELITGINKAVFEGASAETIKRYGSAVKEHVVSYSGADNETGKVLQKGLRKIADSKVNPDYFSSNIKQQAGFAAEVKSVARKNAESIINKKDTRYIRTDDLGSINDTLFDIKEVDLMGNEIINSGAQMKFVGKTPKDLLNKLNSKKYEKYLAADAILDIPDDAYDVLLGNEKTKGLIDEKIEELCQQAEVANKKGKAEVAQIKREKIRKYEKIKKNLRKSGLTTEEAIEARTNAKLSIAKDIAKISHRAGKEQMKIGVAIAGSVSIIKNIVSYTKGEKTAYEAAKSVASDTGKGAAVSYTTAFLGTMAKGSMQNAKVGYIRNLAKTNLAAGIVTTAIDIEKSLRRYIKGEIDGARCIEELGKKGLGEIGSAIFGSIGLAAVPASTPKIISVLSGIAGASFGYVAAVAIYDELNIALKEAKIAKEERIQIEAECAEVITMIQDYRKEMNYLVSNYFVDKIKSFNECFNQLDKAIFEENIDNFVFANHILQENLGKVSQFSNKTEFDDLMNSDLPLEF